MASSLKEIIRSGEGSQVEFKKTLSQLEKVAKTLVSFANSRGGLILVGVQDNGFVIGVNQPEEEHYMLEQAAGFYCKPPVKLEIRDEEIFGKTVVVGQVEESSLKPHYALSRDEDWQLYVRSSDQCVIASPLVARALQMEKEGRDSLRKTPVSNNEKALFGFLDKKRRITLKDYAKLINVSKRRAYKILIDLTLSGKLYMHDLESQVFFTKA
jgi:predicted HTH transcriptional regulator